MLTLETVGGPWRFAGAGSIPAGSDFSLSGAGTTTAVGTVKVALQAEHLPLWPAYSSATLMVFPHPKQLMTMDIAAPWEKCRDLVVIVGPAWRQPCRAAPREFQWTAVHAEKAAQWGHLVRRGRQFTC